MNLRNYFWQFEGALSKKMCNKLLRKGLSKKKVKGVTTGFLKDPHGPKAHEELKKKRDSSIRWMSDQWYYNLLHPFVIIANQNAGWNFEWDWSEPSQVTSYTKGQFYGWHRDSYDTSPQEGRPYQSPEGQTIDPTHDINRRGKARKITSILQLTDPKKYEGGDVCLALFESQVETMDIDPTAAIRPDIFRIPRAQGTIFCFPSFLWHSAQPVTKGIRHSINTWHLGRPFK